MKEHPRSSSVGPPASSKQRVVSKTPLPKSQSGHMIRSVQPEKKRKSGNVELVLKFEKKPRRALSEVPISRGGDHHELEYVSVSKLAHIGSKDAASSTEPMSQDIDEEEETASVVRSPTKENDGMDMGGSDNDHDRDKDTSSEESIRSENDDEDDVDDDEEDDDFFHLGNDPNLLGQLVHELEERETSDIQSTRQPTRLSQTPENLLSPTRMVTRKRQQATPLSQVREASRTPTRVTKAKRVPGGGGKDTSTTPRQRTKRASEKADILEGLDAAREVFSQNVRDPIERVYQAVDAEFPRQEPPTPSPRPVPRSRPAPRPSDVFTSDEEEVRETVARRDRIAEQKAKKRAEAGRTRREKERARVIATPHSNASPTGNPRTIVAAPADPRRMLEVSGARSPSVTSSGGTGPRRRRMWTRQDEEELERGLEKHQYHTRRWRLILDEGKAKGLFQGRHNVDLNNKARQMKEARLKAGLPLGGFEYALDRHPHT
ncbi:hypothetical protein SpCBS45565_g03343 [Spizellomyces sp. 'palustris']|nr:hypothetical protein SpCBS45565_g03343 [Spizellomyces sp. 'palustris']